MVLVFQDIMQTLRYATQVLAIVKLRMEQVLPRPRTGLLARMMRLAPLLVEQQAGCAEPVHLLPAGAEIHMSLHVFQERAGCSRV